MKLLPTIILLLLLQCLPIAAEEVYDPPESTNPLEDYIYELDEVGRTLSGWQGDNREFGSWFFGSYAMLILQNNGNNSRDPFPGLESVVPVLWSDFKYLTPRYLVEFAGGTLSFGDLMLIAQARPFERLRTEEKFIQYVAGLSYLDMLENTVGDSVFQEIILATMTSIEEPILITGRLSHMVTVYSGPELGRQFELALSTSSWMDIEIKKVRKTGDSLDVYLDYKGSWSFPADVLFVSAYGDSTIRRWGLDETGPIRISKRDCESIIVDPEHHLAEFYRYNNKWPRIKKNIRIQPFAALPDWEYFRIVVKPSHWSDWDGDERYGLKIIAGHGIDLWPAYPSDYRHRYSLELNTHTPVAAERSLGVRFTFGHPLDRQRRLFSDVSVHGYDDWTGFSAQLIKYFGKQRFLIQGSALRYQRFSVGIERDAYLDTLVWEDRQDIRVLKSSYSGLSLTNRGDRLFINIRAAAGAGPHGSFSLFKSQMDLSGVFWKVLVGGLQFVAGTQNSTTPSPYQFTHAYAWQDNLAALPNFRGQNKIERKTNNYMGLSLSGGYWLSGIQIKLFGSSMIYDQIGMELSEVKPQYAAGFGFEHKSFFTAGFYFPVWQSHPLAGEGSWAWRYQWRLAWNL